MQIEDLTDCLSVTFPTFEEISFGKSYSFNMLFTPKYHCEITGEGIEYSWGASKRLYRKYPLKDKRQCKQFRKLAKECVEKVNIPMSRKFSRKARSYMLVYLHMKMKKQNDGNTIDISYEDIEKLQKTYRSHRDANCIDGKFITQVMKQSID